MRKTESNSLHHIHTMEGYLLGKYQSRIEGRKHDALVKVKGRHHLREKKGPRAQDKPILYRTRPIAQKLALHQAKYDFQVQW